MTQREYVIAQIKHEQTDFIPYSLRLESDASQMLTKYYGSGDWGRKVLSFEYRGPGCFDSWDAVKSRDPQNPGKWIDVYGNHWDSSGPIHHLDRNGMYGMEPEDYKWPELDEFLTPEKMDRIKKWASSIPSDRFSIISIGAGHWELIWRLLGVEEALIMCIAEPDKFDYIIDKLDKMINKFVDFLVQTPADALLISDDWCDQRTCTMGPDRWRQFIKPRLEKIYQKIHDSGKYVINHVCGNVDPLLPDLVEIGLDVLESVQPEAMNVYEMKKQFGDKITFYGAFGVQHLLQMGTPDDIRNEIRKLRRELGKGGGCILAPAKPITSVAPVENVAAVYETFVEDNYKCL